MTPRSGQPDVANASESGDDRVGDSDSEILIAGDQAAHHAERRTASWTVAAGPGGTTGAFGLDRNSAAPANSRSVRRPGAATRFSEINLRNRPDSRALRMTPAMRLSSSRRSAADGHRSSGLFARHRAITSSTPSGTDGTSSRSGVGSCAMMAVIRLAPVRPSKAFVPLTIS